MIVLVNVRVSLNTEKNYGVLINDYQDELWVLLDI
jgi:hypothetical protein